jgi:hypothetical protein
MLGLSLAANPFSRKAGEGGASRRMGEDRAITRSSSGDHAVVFRTSGWFWVALTLLSRSAMSPRVLPKRRERANLTCQTGMGRHEIHEDDDRAQADRGEENLGTSAALGAKSARGR